MQQLAGKKIWHMRNCHLHYLGGTYIYLKHNFMSFRVTIRRTKYYYKYWRTMDGIQKKELIMFVIRSVTVYFIENNEKTCMKNKPVKLNCQ